MAKKKTVKLSVSKNKLYLIILATLVIATVAIIYSLATLGQFYNLNKITNKCSKNGISQDLRSISRKYTVKPGDSLLLIAQNELGDSSRYRELAEYNARDYPELFDHGNVTTFLESGWILQIPPTWIKSSSGVLQIINGMIFDFKPDDHTPMITTLSDKKGWNATLGIDTDTINRSGTKFKIGDCVIAIEDVGLNRIIKIDLQ